MSSLSRNQKILLIVGLVVLVLCAIGAIVQWSVYAEFAGSKPAGSGGNLVEALTTWGQSDAAKAEQALNMVIFMIVGCVIGVVLMVLAVRKPKEKAPRQEVRFYEEVDDPEARAEELRQLGYTGPDPYAKAKRPEENVRSLQPDRNPKSVRWK